MHARVCTHRLERVTRLSNVIFQATSNSRKGKGKGKEQKYVATAAEGKEAAQQNTTIHAEAQCW